MLNYKSIFSYYYGAVRNIIFFTFLLFSTSSFSQAIQMLSICDGDSIFLANSWQKQGGTYISNTPNGPVTTFLTINPLPVITPNFILNGNAQIQAGNVFQLTQAAGGQSGSVWNNIMIDLNQPFHFDIDVYLGCNPTGNANNGGADGIAFVLQPISTSLGSSGGGLGYQNISPSFAVEFDTWQNATDPWYNHIAIQRNGDLNHNGINNLAQPVGIPPGTGSLEDCNWHEAIFSWNPSTFTFSLDFDGVNIINYTGDIVTTIFGGNSNVFWGFTGATGWAYNLQQFRFNYNFSDTTICKHDTITLNSMATAASYNYLWTPNYNISNNSIASPNFYPDSTTLYFLDVSNSYGCTYKDSFTLFVDTVDVIGTSTISNLCYGGSNGQATVLIGGNNSPYTYQWNDLNNQNTQTANNLSAGQYNCIISDNNQCTDTIEVNITEPQQVIFLDIQQACDSYTWIDGNTYTTSNNTATFLYQTNNGCDSLVILDLTINYSSNSTDIQQACDSYTWIDGVTYTQSNSTATYIIPNGNSNGCDSIINLDLTIYLSSSSTDTHQACGFFTWVNGITYIQDNSTATFTIPNGNSNGCDSVITLDLTINNTTSSNEIVNACDSYTWINGITYNQSNSTASYIIPNSNSNGCDSIVFLDLKINYSTTSTDAVQACDSLTWIDGITYTASNNTASFMYQTVDGCDSLVTLDLTINYSATSTDVQQACDSYTWVDGVNYTSSNNTASFMYQTVDGCDSLVSLDLTINYSTSITDVVQACDSYTWIDGITYTQSNSVAIYSIPNGNSNGCDSIITLNLTIFYSYSNIDIIQACDSYTWVDGITYTASNNTANFMYPTIDGCDSLITLDLTINYSTSSTDVIQACDSYTWVDGITYTSSNNTATFMFQTNGGCDSLVTLDLTINYSATSTDVIQACNSYTWVDGITYTASNNTASYIYQTVDGCDSLVTLDLTINYSYSGIDVQYACDSYTWIDGITYTVDNNTATYLYQTIDGCDSLLTLDLSIYFSSASIDIHQACSSFTWINGITYTQSTTTASYLIANGNSNGCDSIITLHLTILQSPVANFSYNQFNLCYPEIEFVNTSDNFTGCFWEFGDNDTTYYLNPHHTYEEPGKYLVTLFVDNMSGCIDSTSYTIDVDRETFFIPNSFTPNTDDLNNVFKVYSESVNEINLYIYNRWGETIFYTNNINNGWDGTFLNELCQEGIYSWRLDYFCSDEMVSKMGILRLIR